MLPVDSHVHSEWSWDTAVGSMAGSCARAVELGLAGIAFTEHIDFTTFGIALDGPYQSAHLTSLAASDGQLTPPAFDASGYLAAIAACRERYPDLQILSGLEMGQPHWHVAEFSAVLAAGRFDRVLGSLHCLPDGDGFAEPWLLYPRRVAAEVLREYLADISRWWHEEGGDAVTFGSDAHLPDLVGHQFEKAAAMAQAHGFRPGRQPHDLWGRAG